MNRRVITDIGSLLLELGIPSNLLGFSYIAYAVKLALENPDFDHRISKEIYITVAQYYGTTHAAVERCIRHAIMIGWSLGDYDLIIQIFRNSISPKKGVPTNSQYISSICLYLSQHQAAKAQ